MNLALTLPLPPFYYFDSPVAIPLDCIYTLSLNNHDP